MSEEDLELLITLDEPGDEDVHQLEFENAVNSNGLYPVVFSEGDWRCTLSRVFFETDYPMPVPDGSLIQPSIQKFEIDVCIVACSKQGKIVEQKVFYDLAGMQKKIRDRLPH